MIMANTYERKVTPLQNYVLLENIKKSETKGGILLPDSAHQDFGMMVIEKGDKCENKKLKVGDYVAVSGNLAGIKLEGVPDNLFLVKEDNIIATVNPKK